MILPRSAGVLLHPTSLPGANGIGELGGEALRFLDFLAATGVSLWQVLPLGPTGYGDSPYQCFSAFAGNPLMIAVPADGTEFPAHTVNFETVIPHKRAQLDRAIAAWVPDAGFEAFVAAHASWLEDYSLFMALKEAHGGIAWPDWDAKAAARDPDALASWREFLAPSIARYNAEQYLFYAQFAALRRAATERGIRIMGDLPIYVAHDSADVWSNPTAFKLRADGRPLVQAGVPPDYFSATGQLWGNPIYDWDTMRGTGFEWWLSRLRAALEQVDIIRLEHFRGFVGVWEVPGGDATAENGSWVDAPGKDLFEAVTSVFG